MRHLFFTATILALVVVILGAYTRLTDSGLGCPDWPGCYGQMIPRVMGHESRVTSYESPIDIKKAWTEMIHRYFAGTLGLFILVIAIISIKRRRQPGQPFLLPLLLLGAVIFQALLGMWTVTLLLNPLVVMGHLLGGMTTLGLCWWLTLTCRGGPLWPPDMQGNHRGLPLPFAPIAALIILILQIALGGWVSANYAALACPDFPTCMGSWWPQMNWAHAFDPWKSLGAIDNEARVAIHILHRLGAVVTFLVLGFLAVKGLTGAEDKSVKATSIIMILLLIAQVTLGISTVLFIRPLEIATAHNAVAALLLLTVIALNDQIARRLTS
ncbi:MAG: COX15/CtaA family protein [Deltaproteobacteria bacterium]|nr:COX15/CtaA family protein [Deltaproteobacteria bacterium]